MEKRSYDNNILAFDRITKNTKRIIDTILKEHGLRSTHASCFFRICEANDGLTSTELAEACGVDKAFISRVTAELIEKGHIAKADGTEGKYKIKFELTESGRQINREIVNIVMECIDKVDAHISVKKLEIFYELLGGIDRGIETLVKKEK